MKCLLQNVEAIQLFETRLHCTVIRWDRQGVMQYRVNVLRSRLESTGDISRICVFSFSLICCARTLEGQLPLKSHFKTVADRENVGWPLGRAEAPQTRP
jgi:hypothetical protein